MFQEAWGELTADDGKTYKVPLLLTMRPLLVDEGSIDRYTVEEVALSGISTAVPDGKYTLTFPFEGKPKQGKFRIVDGRLRGGW